MIWDLLWPVSSSVIGGDTHAPPLPNHLHLKESSPPEAPHVPPTRLNPRPPPLPARVCSMSGSLMRVLREVTGPTTAALLTCAGVSSLIPELETAQRPEVTSTPFLFVLFHSFSDSPCPSAQRSFVIKGCSSPPPRLWGSSLEESDHHRQWVGGNRVQSHCLQDLTRRAP